MQRYVILISKRYPQKILLDCIYYASVHKCHFIDVICYASATVNKLHNSGLECANGDFASSWGGCLNQGSLRIRCPRDYFPCNDLSGNRIEFSCRENCTRHGGLKDCIVEGIFKHSA